MDLTARLYLILLGLVGLCRLLELRISRRHIRELAARGAAQRPEPRFRWMVLLHTTALIFAGLEVSVLQRPFIPALAAVMGALFLLSNALRWWVILSMAEHWNVRVVSSVSLGVVTRGPFRWIRHPNYVAVFVELLALPLLHGAWLTALAFGLLHVGVLYDRIALEERVLLADAGYREAMAHKPRFVPRAWQWWTS